MKKLLLTIVVVLLGVPLILGGFLGVQYYLTTEDSIPEVRLGVDGAELEPNGYSWSQPVFWGLLYKDFVEKPSLEAERLGTLEDPKLGIQFPEGYSSVVKVEYGGEVVWTGVASEWANYSFTQNGDFVVEVSSEKVAEGVRGYGSFTFRFALTAAIEPTMQASATSVKQGDVLAITLNNLTGDMNPQVESSIEYASFVSREDGTAVAYVPITYNREPGYYSVLVRAGTYSWNVEFRVVAYEFERQDMTIDTSNETISEANSPAAYQEYRDKIYPIFEQVDPNVYWEGEFVHPVAGARVSTAYGLYRYTNGAETPSRHAGIDYSADEGTDIIAPNNGVVVFSEYLLNTGNTLVIEHGGGLKSYFFHCEELLVEVGDMVYKNDLIARVGSTGYSTGPHAHYEVRIGNQSINPSFILDGTAGLYKAE